MKRLVLKLPIMVTSIVWNMRTETDVLGISTLGMLLSIMVTKSVLNMHTQTTVLGVGNMALLYARGKTGSGSLNH